MPHLLLFFTVHAPERSKKKSREVARFQREYLVNFKKEQHKTTRNCIYSWGSVKSMSALGSNLIYTSAKLTRWVCCVENLSDSSLQGRHYLPSEAGFILMKTL